MNLKNQNQVNKSYTNGLTLVALVVTIIVLLILAGVSLNLVLGDNGILTKATNVEIEYNKSEVLEQLNLIITEKYLEAYHQAINDKKEVSEYYSATKVIEFLQTAVIEGLEPEEGQDSYVGYIEALKDDTGNTIANQYFVKMPSLQRNISRFGLGKNDGSQSDIFIIVNNNNADGDNNDVNDYVVKYISNDGTEEEIGILQMQPTL